MRESMEILLWLFAATAMMVGLVGMALCLSEHLARAWAWIWRE